jgi:hypothetical protein
MNPSSLSQGLVGAATYSFPSETMTTEVCIAACQQKNANWAMTASTYQCYCGNNLANSIGPGYYVTENQCTLSCGGNSTQTCGDYYRYSVYDLSKAPSLAKNTTHPLGWMGKFTARLTMTSGMISDRSSRLARSGCFKEGTGGQNALDATDWSSSTLTPQTCMNDCSELGYKLSAVEGGNSECTNCRSWFLISDYRFACKGATAATHTREGRHFPTPNARTGALARPMPPAVPATTISSCTTLPTLPLRWIRLKLLTLKGGSVVSRIRDQIP